MTGAHSAVTMPQLGETVTEGTVTQWLKQPGDRVEQDEPLLEVSTDKVDSEIPSPAAGYLTDIVVDEGETVPVGAVLAHLSDVPTESRADAPTDPRPGRRDGPGGTFLSPAVRRLVADRGLDPAALTGTGPDGRVTRAEVLEVVGRDDTAPAAPVPAEVADDDDEVITFTALRRRTAEHLTRSLATAAHALVVMEVDYANVERVRQPLRARFAEQTGVALTYLPFIARAAVDAIAEFPQVNASVRDDSLVVHRRIHLGVAVDLDFEGLVVPVIRDAPELRLPALARRVAELAERARAGELAPDDVSAGTFTITNAGGYGTLITGPIINHPEVAILSTDSVKVRPVAVPVPGGGHGLGFHPVGNLALSFDHRAYDGAYASAFLARVKEVLEERDWGEELAEVGS